MNCIIVDDDEVSRLSIEKCMSSVPSLNLIASCGSAVEAIKVLSSESIDLIFLDIEMPEMSGIEFIRNYSDLPQVIFTTSSTEFAIEAFEFNVTDYIVKPIMLPRFIKAVNKAIDMHKSVDISSIDNGNIFVKQDSRLIKLNTKEMFYIEALADYVQIYSSLGRNTILSTMKAIERKLPQEEFVRVHRSYIVRIDQIKEIEDNTILINDKLVPISRSYKEKLMNKLKTL